MMRNVTAVNAIQILLHLNIKVPVLLVKMNLSIVVIVLENIKEAPLMTVISLYQANMIS